MMHVECVKPLSTARAAPKRLATKTALYVHNARKFTPKTLDGMRYFVQVKKPRKVGIRRTGKGKDSTERVEYSECDGE